MCSVETMYATLTCSEITSGLDDVPVFAQRLSASQIIQTLIWIKLLERCCLMLSTHTAVLSPRLLYPANHDERSGPALARLAT